MTKEELLEDVLIGGIVKIYTESDETFEGTVTDFGESGLKITLLNSNKAKRIMYGRITEYDIEDTQEISSAITTTIVDIAKNVSEDNAVANSEPIVKSDMNTEDSDVARTTDTKAIVQFDRDNIFDEVENEFDLESIRGEWISRLDSKQKSEYNRIADILNYAKKVNEYKLEGDRVRRAITEYKKLSSEIISMNVFIALIYHEFNDVSTAVDYYQKGGAYDVVFRLSLVYG
ncbi:MULTISPECIES: hypothetical protein [unclassified Ruminococcus]|uniref:hypothetical protein n=1 Tax=unclassified Ruminococcus TaxID=2608920 RepID=UPI00319EAB28